MRPSIHDTIALLKELIRTPSFSKEEDKTADILQEYVERYGIVPQRVQNNIILRNSQFASNKPTILLNSHHDTVKVNEGWTKDPFGAEEVNGIIYGLGSNDAGASLVSLLHVFLHFYAQDMPVNIMYIASAEEEISGKNGLELALKSISETPTIGIVGEPTEMQMAIAEKGLMVIDAETKGKAGHVANQWGDNAIYEAVKDIQWIEKYRFSKTSEFLNQVKLTVSQIEGGQQHNVVPDTCKYVIDCRINEQYSFEEILETLRKNCNATMTPRSTRLKPSKISKNHPLVLRGIQLGLHHYGSNTMSDQVFLNCPSLKIGPGDTNRSHRADEYIHISEIKKGIEIYTNLLSGLQL